MEQYMQSFFYEFPLAQPIETTEEEYQPTFYNTYNHIVEDNELNFSSKYLNIAPYPFSNSINMRFQNITENDENELVNPDFFLNPVFIDSPKSYGHENSEGYQLLNMNEIERSN